jgi:hypothetical protein
LALEASAQSLLIDGEAGPYGWKRFPEFPRQSIPFAIIPKQPPVGAATFGGLLEPHHTPSRDEGRDDYL